MSVRSPLSLTASAHPHSPRRDGGVDALAVLVEGRAEAAVTAERGSHDPSTDMDMILTSTGIRYSFHRMRTTLDLPDDLLQEAQRLLGFKSKTDVVVLSLRELIRRRRLDGLKELLGQVTLDIDVPRSRRRPRRRT